MNSVDSSRSDLALRSATQNCVCVVGLRGIPDVMGGIETHCEELYPRLKAELGTDFRIVVLSRRPYAPRAGSFAGVDIWPVHAPRSKYFETIVHTALAIVTARSRFSANIVHIHAIGPALLAPLAAMLGMKVIVTHHGEDFNRAKWNWFAKWMLRSGEKAAVRWADRVIVISQALQSRLENHYSIGARQIVHIPNGVSTAEQVSASDAVLERFGLQPGQFVIGVGRLVPEKGFQDLLQAYSAFRSRTGSQKKLVIVGDADHQDKFARDLMENASDGVIFTGRVSRPQVLSMLRSASLFVLPSYHEGLPFAGLEAIAANAPIIASNIVGNMELGLPQDNYFAPGDVRAMLEKLVEDHARYRVDRAILSRFDWSEIASKTASLYRSLLADGR